MLIVEFHTEFQIIFGSPRSPVECELRTGTTRSVGCVIIAKSSYAFWKACCKYCLNLLYSTEVNNRIPRADTCVTMFEVTPVFD